MDYEGTADITPCEVDERKVDDKEEIGDVGAAIDPGENHGNADYATINQFIRHQEDAQCKGSEKRADRHPEEADRDSEELSLGGLGVYHNSLSRFAIEDSWIEDVCQKLESEFGVELLGYRAYIS